MFRVAFILLFAGAAQAADIEGLDMVRSKADGARAGAITTVRKPSPVRRGKTAIRFEIRPGDCVETDCGKNRERVELKSRSVEVEGNLSRYRWSFYLPKSFKPVWPARQFIAQFHQEGGPPAMLFSLEPEGLVFESRFAEGRGHLLIPAAELNGRWHDISAEIDWSRHNGRAVITVNGERRYDARHPTMSEAEAYFKIGLYRAHLDRNPQAAALRQVMYVDAISRD